MIAQKINKWLKGVMAAAMTLTVATSCHDMWHQDYSDCPNGVYVKFKYDYNLQRADMFNDHVGRSRGIILKTFLCNHPSGA